MNYHKLITTIEKIYENNSNDNLCLFIDGEWGIGKTFTIKDKWGEKNKEKFDLKYVSVFGKENVKEIEKDLILQIMGIFNVASKINEKNGIKIIGNVAKKVLQKYTGIDFNFRDFIENVAIETLNYDKSEKKIILCIDDIERKSKNIEIKDLLGLIERASTNFNIILIANSSKLKEDFQEYKEKIVDYEFKIDELDLNILEEIAGKRIYYKKESIDLIVQIYNAKSEIYIDFNNSTVSKEAISELSNIRIYKKYVDLVQRLNDEANDILNKDAFNLNEEIITLCKKVVYNYYFNTEKKNKELNKANLDKVILYKEINRMFLYEEFNKTIFKEYLLNDTEISKDIRLLHNLYKMNNSEVTMILNKIDQNVINENLDYFIGQKYIISLVDILSELEMIEKYEEKLLEISNKLYSPVIDEKPLFFDSEDWNEVDIFGMEPCSKATLKIIKLLNKFNLEKHSEYIIKEYKKAIEVSDIDALTKIISNNIIKKIVTIQVPLKTPLDSPLIFM